MEQKEINIDKLVAGDERAFIAFIEYHSSALYHYAFNILHQKECAEEVVSDVFLEVWKHRKKLGKIENIKGWLYRILYNKSISFLRKHPIKYTIPNIAKAAIPIVGYAAFAIYSHSFFHLCGSSCSSSSFVAFCIYGILAITLFR